MLCIFYHNKKMTDPAQFLRKWYDSWTFRNVWFFLSMGFTMVSKKKKGPNLSVYFYTRTRTTVLLHPPFCLEPWAQTKVCLNQTSETTCYQHLTQLKLTMSFFFFLKSSSLDSKLFYFSSHLDWWPCQEWILVETLKEEMEAVV